MEPTIARFAVPPQAANKNVYETPNAGFRLDVLDASPDKGGGMEGTRATVRLTIRNKRPVLGHLDSGKSYCYKTIVLDDAAHPVAESDLILVSGRPAYLTFEQSSASKIYIPNEASRAEPLTFMTGEAPRCIGETVNLRLCWDDGVTEDIALEITSGPRCAFPPGAASASANPRTEPLASTTPARQSECPTQQYSSVP